MKIVVDDLPWEKDLTHNHMRYGAGGGYRKKEHVQAWMKLLGFDRVNLRAHHWGLNFQWRVLPNGEIKVELLNPEFLHLPIKVTVDFRFPDERKRDDHNYYKVICDSVAAGLGIDDKHIRIHTGSVVVDRKNPGFTIEVKDFREERCSK